MSQWHNVMTLMSLSIRWIGHPIWAGISVCSETLSMSSSFLSFEERPFVPGLAKPFHFLFILYQNSTWLDRMIYTAYPPVVYLPLGWEACIANCGLGDEHLSMNTSTYSCLSFWQAYLKWTTLVVKPFKRSRMRF